MSSAWTNTKKVDVLNLLKVATHLYILYNFKWINITDRIKGTVHSILSHPLLPPDEIQSGEVS